MTRIRRRSATSTLLVLLLALSAQGVSEARPEREETGRPSGDEREVVLGSLSPDRPPSGPRNHLAAPDCANRHGSREGAPGCSEEAGQAGGPSASNSFKGGPGCSIQCITSGVAYARGVGAELKVKTDTPARITIHVEGFVSQVSDAGVKQFAALFPDLDPNTTYTAHAWATDNEGIDCGCDGHTSHASGSFTTLRRFASVEFNPFDLAEPVADGAGVFDFFFRVAGAWQPNMEETHSDPALPPTLPGVRKVGVLDAPKILDVAVQVIQRDWGPCEQAVSPGPYDIPSGDVEDCRVWNTAIPGIFEVNLDTSWGPHQIPVVLHTVDEPLTFAAPVTIDVWYA